MAEHGAKYVADGDPFTTGAWIPGIPASAFNPAHPLQAEAVLGTSLYESGPVVPEPEDMPVIEREPGASGPAAIPLARNLPDAPPPADPRDPEPPASGPAARLPYWWTPDGQPETPAAEAPKARRGKATEATEPEAGTSTTED